MTPASAIVRRVAGFGLGDAAEISPVSDGSWPALLERVVRERLTGHAVRAATDGLWPLTSQQLDELLDRHEEQLAIDLRIERLLLRLDHLFAGAGIPMRVLKGPATARRFYDTPELRSFGDADILVRGADVGEAIELLGVIGFARNFRAPRPSFDRRFTKAVSLRATDGLEIDLHRALTPGPFGVLIDVDEAMAAPPDRVEIAGHQLRCLNIEFSLVHACAHAALGDTPPKLVPLRDVAQLVRSSVDTAAVIEMMERFRAGVVAQRAVLLVEDVLEMRVRGAFGDWARSYVATRRDRAWLRSYRPGADRYRTQAAATLWALPTTRQRLVYASALAFPSRDYLRDHDGRYSRRIVRSASAVARWRPR
jgi:hypothetical protein